MTPKDVGNNIVYFRKKCNLSQKELAKKLNVSNKLVSKWETGLSYPSIEYLNEISTILEVDIRYLISSNEEEIKNIDAIKTNKKKRKNLIYSLVGVFAIIAFIGVTFLNAFLIFPSVFKYVYANEVDKYIENTFNSQNITINQTVEVDGVTTKGKEEMSLDKTTKELRYKSYEDDKLTMIIYHDVQYDIENYKKTIFNKEYNNLSDFYDEISDGDELNLDALNKDTIKYIRKDFSNYAITLDYKDINNMMSNIPGLSNARIKSDVKVKIEIKKKKLKSLQMKFKMSVKNEIVDVVGKFDFSYPSDMLEINLTDEQIHLNWDVPGQDVESVFGDKLEVIDEKYSSKFTTYNDQIIYFEDTYIRSYNIETQEKKVLYNLGDIAIGYINKIQVVNGNLYYYDKDGSCKLTLTTSVPTWTRLSAEKYLFIDNNEDIYYLSNGKLKLLNTETVLLGNKVIGRIDENLYTVDTSKNIIYVYNGTELKKSLDLSTVNKDIAEYGYDVGNFTIVNNHIIFKFTYNGYVYALDKELNLKYNKQIDDTSRITIICEDEDLLVNEYGIYSKNYEIPPLRMSVSNFSSCGNYYIFDYNKDRFTQVSCKIEKQDLINTLFAQVYQY